MNIFFSDADPKVAAHNLDDKRVVKMILESAQMLCTALRIHGAAHLAKYKSTHVNHPSNVWARATDSNYAWLLEHFAALCTEYTNRYGKIHACASMYGDLQAGQAFIPKGDLTPFANCAARSDMGIDYKGIPDTTVAYKNYLAVRWKHDTLIPKWTNTRAPAFYLQLGQFRKTLARLSIY